jgi:small subunit ribosomal protein S21
MANRARVRVELKKKYNDPHRNFKDMLQEFKRRVSNAGILHDYKEHQFYESPSEKNRKKRKEAEKKRQMETLERKILGGERVKASAGLIKKVMANLAKNKRDNKKRNYRQDD